MRNLFDGEFYLRTNPDVAAARMDPLEHYLKYGEKEQRQPHPLFDPLHYLAGHARANGQWANPHPLFDCEAYLKAHPDVTGNPLEHYAAGAPSSGAGPIPVMIRRSLDPPDHEAGRNANSCGEMFTIASVAA